MSVEIVYSPVSERLVSFAKRVVGGTEDVSEWEGDEGATKEVRLIYLLTWIRGGGVGIERQSERMQ